MRKLAFLLVSAFLVTGLTNCNKNEELMIKIDSPEAGVTYPNTGSLAIKGKVTAKEVDEVEIEIKLKATGEKVFDFDKHVHAKKEYKIDKTWTWNTEQIQAKTEFEFKIKAKEDHDGDPKVLEFTFFVAP